MIATGLAGAGLGAVAAVVASKSGREPLLTAGYGIEVTAATWFAVALIHSYRVEGMGGLPYAAAAGMLLWSVLVPVAVGVGYLEWKGRDSRRTAPEEPDGFRHRAPNEHHELRAQQAPSGSLTFPAARGISMRTGCILVLLTWSRFLLGSTGPIALLVVFLVGWTGGGRWESATRGSPHRLAHTLAPWILALPTFISWAISFGSLWGGR